MQQFKLLGSALAAAVILVACGGGGDGNQSPAVAYTSVVSFGDSLSDAGSYKVGPIAALGGGQFTVNGITGAVGSDPVPSYTWAQVLSAAVVGKASCAAHTGGFGVARSAVIAGCTDYAQGGARVTEAAGPGNTGQTSGVFTGAMTEPVVTQVASYLTDLNNGGKFSGKELVTVLAGANDIFAQTDKLKADATAAGSTAFVQSLVQRLAAGATSPAAAATAIGTALAGLPAGTAMDTVVGTAVGTAAIQPGNAAVASPAVYGPMVVAAQTDAATAGAQYAATTGATTAVTGMVTAATQLVASVKGMLANGATHIAVSNLPDVSQTPMAMAQDASSRALILAMTSAFNNALKAGLTGTAGVVLIDAFAENQRQMADPAHYALTNTTATACNLNYPNNPLATNGVANSGSSLACKSSNLIAGDTSHYAFADSVHPTPYMHKLLAQFVTKQLILAGWL